jgi:hypothetical protein
MEKLYTYEALIVVLFTVNDAQLDYTTASAYVTHL